MRIQDQFFPNLAKGLGAIAVLLALYLSSLHSYLLFHTLIELFSIVIAGAVFVLAWNFRQFYRDSFLIFIGSTYLFCSLIDLVHTLSYKGMGLLPGYDANLPTQLWVAARFLQSISLLVAPFFLRRKVKIELLLAGFTLFTSLLLLSIFVWDIFPTSYVEGVGLTSFKIASEYSIDLFLAAAIVHLLQKREFLDRKVLPYMVASIGLIMLGELAFTFYINVYSLSNLIGHFCKIIAYFFVYKATIETEAGKIYTDITRLRSAEQALRDSERQAQRSLAELQSIYAHTPIGLCFYDTQLRYQAINEMLAKVNGRSVTEHIGKPLQEVLPGKVAQAVERSLRQVLSTGQPVLNQEISGLPGDRPGQIAYFLVSYHPVSDEEGNPLGVSCVVQDVTEQRQAEEAIKSSERTLKLFIEYAPAGIAMFDREMRYLAASRRFLDDYHLTEQEIIGRSHYEVFPYIPERWKSVHQRCLAGSIEIAQEDSIDREDGSTEWLRWAVHPWYNTLGEIGGIILFTEAITERKQMEAALEERAKQLRILGDHLPEGAIYRYVQDVNGTPHFELMSAGIEAIIGVPADEILSSARALHNTIVLEDYQHLVAEEANSREKLAPFELEVRQRHRVTGEIHWSLLRSMPSQRADGFTVWDGIQIDITERKRAELSLRASEAQLRESEAKFRLMGEALPYGVWLCDPDGKCLYASQSFLDLLEMTMEEMQGFGWTHRLPPEEVAPMLERWMHCVQTGQDWDNEHHVLGPDGRYHTVLTRGKPVRDESGKITCWVGINLDIDARKVAEKALQESEKRFRSIFEANMVGVVFADPDTGAITDANDEYLRIIGRSREELATGAINWRTITPPDGLEKEEQERFSLPPGKSRKPFEKEYLQPDGTLVPVIIGGSYLDEAMHHVVAFVLDNSERKRMTEELAEINSALQAYAEQLKKSNQELEQFAFVASHDLQEPLRKIKMFGERLKTQLREEQPNSMSSDAAESLARMQNAADRMQTMISGLLELSRVHTQGGTFEPTHMTLLVNDVVNDLEARIQSTVGQVIVDELYSAEVDGMQMRRLFQNLIGNALKFHKPDVAPIIHISGTIARSLEGSSITITVRDNGIGFDEKYATRIFQPFQRLNGKDEYEGTGLGLSICQKIVERHHGKIIAHSQPGEGSVFCITLPVHHPGNEYL